MYNAVQHYTFFKPVQPIQEDVYCVWFVVPQASRLLGFWPNLENNHLESLKRTRLFCLEEGGFASLYNNLSPAHEPVEHQVLSLSGSQYYLQKV